ncbi:hypothetical protein Ppb6_02583 [Photorhabdus australis subsp. thailandensis]|uniref:Uncharacterized protein n=1 Tax=Photorhabdus australis subsp. thailandensis TaxID=2805096 RepID=A0A1C0U305_9GAMM|nr:hypothetical protein Ppb6_02583 [Photorhabdus australis subsp. thailandensis]
MRQERERLELEAAAKQSSGMPKPPDMSKMPPLTPWVDPNGAGSSKKKTDAGGQQPPQQEKSEEPKDFSLSLDDIKNVKLKERTEEDEEKRLRDKERRRLKRMAELGEEERKKKEEEERKIKEVEEEEQANRALREKLKKKYQASRNDDDDDDDDHQEWLKKLKKEPEEKPELQRDNGSKPTEVLDPNLLLNHPLLNQGGDNSTLHTNNTGPDEDDEDWK